MSLVAAPGYRFFVHILLMTSYTEHRNLELPV
jgi:hypothetical protein